MKINIRLLLVLVAVLTASLVGLMVFAGKSIRPISLSQSVVSGATMPASPAQDSASRREEKYEVSTVLQLDYGSGDQQVGLIAGIEDFRALGPTSFAIKGQTVYILDGVNERVKAFDQNGEMVRSFQIDNASDIAIGNGQRLYVLDNSTNVINEYIPGLDTPVRHVLDRPMTELRMNSENGTVSARTNQEPDAAVYTFNGSIGALNTAASLDPYLCLKVGEHKGKVVGSQGGKGFNVTTDNALGSISCLGQDRDLNLYIVIEELLPSDTIQVNKEVRKYTPDGRLLAVIPVNIDYAAHPEKELFLDENGDVYHLLPTMDHLIVEKWARRD